MATSLYSPAEQAAYDARQQDKQLIANQYLTTQLFQAQMVQQNWENLQNAYYAAAYAANEEHSQSLIRANNLSSEESPMWQATKTFLSVFFGDEIYGGGKALVTGDAGRALGERAVGIVQTQTGQAFTGSASDWARFGRGVAGDLVGVNGVVEAGYGYDISNQQQLDAWQRTTRGAGRHRRTFRHGRRRTFNGRPRAYIIPHCGKSGEV